MIKKALISFAVVIVAFIAIIALFFVAHAPSPPSGIPAPGAGEGTLEGQVLLGPTCPVERIPPLPGCAPRPYATTVLVFDANNTTTPAQTVATDASGTFAVTLPAGAYVIQAKSGLPFPHCGDTNVSVAAGVTVTTTLSCDTGIR